MSQDLSKLKVTELQDLCIKKGIPYYGKKSALIKRLRSCNNNELEDAPPSKRRKLNNNNNNEIDDEMESELEDDDLLVTLNVGGTKYCTTNATLMNYKQQNHILSNLPINNKQECFIDRDGTHFKYILNFLRDGKEFKKHVLPNLDKKEIIHLKQESKYFKLYDCMFDKYDSPIHWKFHFCYNDATETVLTKDYSNAVSHIFPPKWIENERTVTFDLELKPQGCNNTMCDVSIGVIKDFNEYDDVWFPDRTKSDIGRFEIQDLGDGDNTIVKCTIDFNKCYFAVKFDDETWNVPLDNPSKFSKHLRIVIWTPGIKENQEIAVSVL